MGPMHHILVRLWRARMVPRHEILVTDFDAGSSIRGPRPVGREHLPKVDLNDLNKASTKALPTGSCPSRRALLGGRSLNANPANFGQN